MRKLKNQLLYPATFLLFIVSCKKESSNDSNTDVAFNYTVFADSLEHQLDKTQYGYSITIYKGGDFLMSRNGGESVKAIDGGTKLFADTTRIHMASITKTLTTMAAIKLLSEKNIPLSEQVYKYLPAAWTKGPGFTSITFRELLTHTSGLRDIGGGCTNNDPNFYSGLKDLVAQGVVADKSYCYQNGNFGLFRILLPIINGVALTGNDNFDNTITQQGYNDLMQQYVFSKEGITASENYSPGNALLYEYPYTSKAGFNPGSLGTRAGGLGWYLSTKDVAKIMSTFSNSADQSIISNAWKDSILTRSYGCFTSNTTKGTAYWHDGIWYSYQGAGCQGMRSIWMKLPVNDMTVVLVVNALRGPSGFPIANTGITQYVLNAFNAVVK